MTYPTPPTTEPIADSDTAMPDGFAWDTPQPDEAAESLFRDDPSVDEAAAFVADTDAEPDATILEPKKRSRKAEQYEGKTRGLFRFAFNATVQNPKTVPDAATILLYGPDISKAMGDLAAENDWAAKAVDMLTDTTDNAAAALMMASVPFVLQMMRNHEPVADVTPEREIKIPFTQRRFRVRFKFKLRRFRKFTAPPEQVTHHVFSNPAVQEQLKKQGITVV